MNRIDNNHKCKKKVPNAPGRKNQRIRESKKDSGNKLQGNSISSSSDIPVYESENDSGNELQSNDISNASDIPVYESGIDSGYGSKTNDPGSNSYCNGKDYISSILDTGDMSRESINTQEANIPNENSSGSIQTEQEYNPKLWYWDTGSDTHVVGCKDYYVEYHELQHNESQGAISGFTSEFHTKASGYGTIKIEVEVNGEIISTYLDDVLYVENAKWNLFSPCRAITQGYNIELKGNNFLLKKRDKIVIISKLDDDMWTFYTSTGNRKDVKDGERIVNYTKVQGAADIQTWHRRLAHVNEKYILEMNDNGIVKGMTIT